ncbi:unnamed protein product [Bathycoccus prasinos]
MASLTSSVAFAIKSSPKLSSKTNSRAQFTNNNKSASSFGRKNQSFQIVRAEGEAAPAWSAPKLDPNTPSPIFGGSTGGLLRKAQVEEFYVLTWKRRKNKSLKCRLVEQCMALVTTFRAKKIANGCIYRVFPSGEVQYLHPKDGVYPEKVNAGRVGANQNMRSIGKNTNPVNVKFQGKGTFDV